MLVEEAGDFFNYVAQFLLFINLSEMNNLAYKQEELMPPIKH